MSMLRGRFGGRTGALMERFGSSIAVDLEMLDEDIDGSIAHATMLGETGILEAGEATALVGALEAVRLDIAEGRFAPTDADEDIHMAVERALTDRLGVVGKKLHTARSRNDQVATDVRLWLLRRVPNLEAAVGDLVLSLVERVERDGRTLMVGYTHLQRGQPILLGHHLLAHAWPLSRDRGRLRDARCRFDRCPLGAGAMAGTPHPIDRQRSSSLLGFAAPSENAMDAWPRAIMRRKLPLLARSSWSIFRGWQRSSFSGRHRSSDSSPSTRPMRRDRASCRRSAIPTLRSWYVAKRGESSAI